MAEIELLLDEYHEAKSLGSNRVDIIKDKLDTLIANNDLERFFSNTYSNYSDNKSDMYEANLMRRLTGLLYLDPKKVGEIKERINLKIK